MLKVFDKEKVACIVLKENEKTKIMSSQKNSDNLIIHNKKGVLTVKNQKFKKNRKIIGMFLLMLLVPILLTGCGKDEQCAEWETVNKVDYSLYEKGSSLYKSCKEHNKNAGNKRCVEWK